MTECFERVRKNVKIVLLEDLNAKVGNLALERVVWVYGVQGFNERGNGSFLGGCFECVIVIEVREVRKVRLRRGERGIISGGRLES